MKNFDIYKFMAIVLTCFVFFNTISSNICEVKANPLVGAGVLTSEGLEAFMTFLSLSGVKMNEMSFNVDDSVTEEEYYSLSDSERKKYIYYDMTTKKYCSSQQLGQAYKYMPVELVKKFNDAGAKKTDDGAIPFDFSDVADWWDFTCDWYSDAFDGLFSSKTFVPSISSIGAGRYYRESTKQYTVWKAVEDDPDKTSQPFSLFVYSDIERAQYHWFLVSEYNDFYYQQEVYSETGTLKSKTYPYVTNRSAFIDFYGTRFYYTGFMGNFSDYGDFTGFASLSGDFLTNSDIVYKYLESLSDSGYTSELGDFTVDENSIADYFSKGIDVTSDDAWNYITDVTNVPKTLENEKGEAIPVTGVAVPGFNVDVADNKITVIPRDDVLTGARPLTNTGTGEATDVVGDDVYTDVDTVISADNDVITNILNVLKALWLWICNFFKGFWDALRSCLDYLFNKILRLFIPAENFLDGYVDEIRNTFNYTFNLGGFDPKMPFGSEKNLKNVEVTVGYGTDKVGGEFDGTVIDYGFLIQAVYSLRPYIRGFIVLMLVIYNINQFCGLIGLPGISLGSLMLNGVHQELNEKGGLSYKKD